MKDTPQGDYNNLTRINQVKDIDDVKLLKPRTSVFLSGDMSSIDDTEPELKCPVKRLTV